MRSNIRWRRTQDSNPQWLSPSLAFKASSLPIRIIRHLNGRQKGTSAHINNKRGLQLIRICLLPPTPQFIGGHLTGSVARRSTFFIFRIPLVVRVAGLEPARAYAQQILSLWCLPIPPYPHIKHILSNAGQINGVSYLGAFSIEVNKTRAIEKANDHMCLPNLDQRDGLEPSSWSWMRITISRPGAYKAPALPLS